MEKIYSTSTPISTLLVSATPTAILNDTTLAIRERMVLEHHDLSSGTNSQISPTRQGGHKQGVVGVAFIGTSTEIRLLTSILANPNTRLTSGYLAHDTEVGKIKVYTGSTWVSYTFMQQPYIPGTVGAIFVGTDTNILSLLNMNPGAVCYDTTKQELLYYTEDEVWKSVPAIFLTEEEANIILTTAVPLGTLSYTSDTGKLCLRRTSSWQVLFTPAVFEPLVFDDFDYTEDGEGVESTESLYYNVIKKFWDPMSTTYDNFKVEEGFPIRDPVKTFTASISGVVGLSWYDHSSESPYITTQEEVTLGIYCRYYEEFGGDPSEWELIGSTVTVTEGEPWLVDGIELAGGSKTFGPKWRWEIAIGAKLLQPTASDPWTFATRECNLKVEITSQS